MIHATTGTFFVFQTTGINTLLYFTYAGLLQKCPALTELGDFTRGKQRTPCVSNRTLHKDLAVKTVTGEAARIHKCSRNRLRSHSWPSCPGPLLPSHTWRPPKRRLNRTRRRGDLLQY